LANHHASLVEVHFDAQVRDNKSLSMANDHLLSLGDHHALSVADD